MTTVTVLIPTRDRPQALTATLTSLCFQTYRDFDIVIADQSDDTDTFTARTPLRAPLRLLETLGHSIKVRHNRPPRGMAHQRQFLLENSTSRYSLFLDDDVIVEPYVLRNLVAVLEAEQCGFAGNAPIGLSHADDVRPHQQHIEFWRERVAPERIVPGDMKWQRHLLHSAANVLHVQRKLGALPDAPLKYKVAWIGGCVLFDTHKLRASGGFGFWKELPRRHCGEDVLAQLRVAKRYGGCGVLPSGVYHQELQTTLPDRRVNAPEHLRI